MPSTPSADSPFPESQNKREGLSPSDLPGMPSTAGKAGGVQTGSLSFPNPPAPDSAAPGRPPTSTGPVPGVATPSPPAADPAAPGAGSSEPPVPNAGQSANGGQPTNPDGTDANGVQTGPPLHNMPKLPAPEQIPPGAVVQTPFGTVEEDETGNSSLALNPEGTLKFKQAKAALRTKLGPMPASLSGPGMPEMPLELGQWNYNPFTGRQERG